MKILVALDSKEYSKKIVKDVARLAQNTLADLVLLGVQDQRTKEPPAAQTKMLLKHRADICSYFDADEIPYGDISAEEFTQGPHKDWQLSTKGIKECTLRISAGGSVAKQTVAVAEEIGADLVILGCSGKLGCEWDGEMNVPLRIAKDAPCAVLVIKQPKSANQIVSILDHSIVSQDSLELINQMVTLHDAGLKIVGVNEKKGSSKQNEMEARMVELLKYYNERDIGAWVKLIDSDDLKDYVTTSSREGIVALWMGKESLIKKLFSISMVDKLLETTTSSLLILR
jgi:nucleotide-binding universal stress UspA family protein